MTTVGFNLVDDSDIDFILKVGSVVEGTELGTRLVELYRLYAPESMSHDEIRRMLVSHQPELHMRSRLSLFQRSINAMSS